LLLSHSLSGVHKREIRTLTGRSARRDVNVAIMKHSDDLQLLADAILTVGRLLLCLFGFSNRPSNDGQSRDPFVLYCYSKGDYPVVTKIHTL
jgi:hypothetical protein